MNTAAVGERLAIDGFEYLVVGTIVTEGGRIHLGVRRPGAFAAALLIPDGTRWRALPIQTDIPLLEAVRRILRGDARRQLVGWDTDYLPIRSVLELLPV